MQNGVDNSSKKTKVWLIILVALLIAALVGMILFHNKSEESKLQTQNLLAQVETLTAEKDALAAENETLATEKEAAETEKEAAVTEKDAAVTEKEEAMAGKEAAEAKAEELAAQVESLQLTAEPEPTAAVEPEPTTTGTPEPTATPGPTATATPEPTPEPTQQVPMVEAAQYDAAMAAASEAEQKVEALTAQAEENAAQITALEEQIAELESGREIDADAQTELQARLDEALAQSEALQAQIEEANAEHARSLAAANAYRINRTPAEGEAYADTLQSTEMQVAADGVTATWSYSNTARSGNAIVLTILVDDAEIYRSEKLAPGESLQEMRLTSALPAGTTEAVAVTTTYDEDGNVVTSQRTPLTITVAE